MPAKQRSSVVAVFHDHTRAQEAVRALRQAGFSEDQIGVVGRHHEKDVAAASEGSKAGAGAATGVAAGAGIAALWSLGITFGVVPVIGPILAAGPLAAALLSAAGGAAAGGLVGALIGLGIPEHEAKYYEGEFHAGRTIVTVHANGRSDEAWAILQRYGAYNRETAATSTAASAVPAATATGAARTEAGQTVQVHEEHLHATKQPVETGEVRVRKEVHTEQQNVQVPVTREEVVIERRPASGHASTSDIRPGEEVRIPVKEEKVHVEKEAVVKEEVNVGKRKVHDTEHVSGTVRKEEVKVEETGNVEVHNRADVHERK